MTNLRLVLFLLLVPLTLTTLACPTRTIARDGGAGGTSETDGGAGATGATGVVGGLGGVGVGLGGSQGGLTGTGGTSSQAGAGGRGLAGNGGTDGTTTCTDTTSDGLNCGSCGHSCLGGACSGSICQPLLLGTVPSTNDYAWETVVSSGQVYVFTGEGQNAPSNVWKADSSTPGTPTEVKTSGILGCLMNGQLFFRTTNGANAIASCTLSNCAATTTPVVTLSSGSYFGGPPWCDTATKEIVWTSTSDLDLYTVQRASATGTDARPITSFQFPDNEWQFVDQGFFPEETNRIFFMHNDFTSGSAFLYYISTNVVNATSVLVATVLNSQVFNAGGGLQSVLANDAVVLTSNYFPASLTYDVFSVPLPNGILSGTPPVFTAGYIYGGVIDQTTFYGELRGSSAVPEDAVIKCPLSDCSMPTIIARGQANASTFADDETAIYWTTTGQASTVAIWKAAK
jgi:hypothetical protein